MKKSHFRASSAMIEIRETELPETQKEQVQRRQDQKHSRPAPEYALGGRNLDQPNLSS